MTELVECRWRKCGQQFTTAELLSHHVTQDHLITERPTICLWDGCKKAKESNYQLVSSHVKTHTGEKPFTCSVCNQSFTHGNSFKNHMKTKHDIIVASIREMQSHTSNAGMMGRRRVSTTISTTAPVSAKRSRVYERKCAEMQQLLQYSLDEHQMLHDLYQTQKRHIIRLKVLRRVMLNAIM